MDKRVLPNERTFKGACGECYRRHVHEDACTVPSDRCGVDPDLAPCAYAGGDGTDPDEPMIEYAGGLTS